MTFSEQIVYAMFNPNKYKELIQLKKSRFVLFAIVISMVLGIVNFVVPASACIARFGGFEKLFDKKIGNIIYQNGELKDDTKYNMTFNGMYFRINTDEETVPESEMKKDGMYVTFGSKYVQMSTVVDGKAYIYQTFGYAGMLSEGFNNQSLVEFIPTIYVYLVLLFISSCIGFYIRYAFFAIILSFLINSINKKLELGLTFSQRFRLCFYGETLGLIISNFNRALGLLPELLVSMVTIFVSVRMISSSLISMAIEKKQ